MTLQEAEAALVKAAPQYEYGLREETWVFLTMRTHKFYISVHPSPASCRVFKDASLEFVLAQALAYVSTNPI